MKPDDLDRRILWEDCGVLAVNKPPDMPTSGRNLDDDDCLQYWLMQRHGGMVWAVHQLDADTSGVNLFVTERRLVAVMKSQMAKESAQKRYLALVRGHPDWEEQALKAPIGPVDERSLGICEDGKPAHSLFTVRAKGDGATLVEARIFTGRTHQIRIHLAHLGHPVLGEEWYVRPACLAHPRQALHAWKMQLDDLDLEVPVPQDLRKLMAEWGIDPGRLKIPTSAL
jgi:23S rRNA-/tRNA-specific pseudouridylate synthase